MSEGFAAEAIALLDLTDLSETADEAGLAHLCERASTPLGPVAAVCIWPRFVAAARQRLAGTLIKVATVVNFPAGTADVAAASAETARAIADGADEIDLVLPYQAVMAGDDDTAAALVGAVRARVPPGRLLKVILETGALGTPERIARAARIAIGAGADFIKTSTGKTRVSATPEAARVMLEVIRAAPRPVGFKASGGIRTREDARAYLALAEAVMGRGWPRPDTFRFGASGLLDALLAGAAAPDSAY
ncbi:deoxyribose-phosphate aldolase [Phreatobacter sp. AB_2022a]|uniref:deoxyribose-phosphate aldolase n=1 Tax=Phreatobacter sp. AB_2022a TaxID=3003134 RepID=UPI00228734D0|nr:deoxyribose-phosphate aldolase [Phreatobacter sp. AB_2022a]MCZ0737168.1 deoxyribose-phosphate aldolase [Phreatobacter sp. AB_2022a]